MFLRSLSPCCQSCQTFLKTHQHSRFRFLKPAAWRRHNRGRGGGRRRVLARPLWRNSDPKRRKSVRVACFERLKKKKNGMPSLMVCISEMDKQGWIARMFIDTWLLASCVVPECLYFTHCNAMCVVVLFCFCLKMHQKHFSTLIFVLLLIHLYVKGVTCGVNMQTTHKYLTSKNKPSTFFAVKC